MLETVSEISPLLQTLALIIGLALAIILHEVAHGYAALFLGDPTAKYAGRLSLNPLNHVDIMGTIIVPLFLILTKTGFLFGWAKPVPVNYYNLKYGKYGPVLVALAGPATNFVLMVLFGLLARFAPPASALPYLCIIISLSNSGLMLFNLLPIPPLDGSKILYLFLEKRPDVITFLERYSMYLLIFIMLFGTSFITQFLFAPAVGLVYFFSGYTF